MSRLQETGPSLRRFLMQQKRDANRAGDASPFTLSGTGVTAVDEMTYEGVLKVLGQMVVDGTLTVNGPMAVTGTLSLPAGIIDNDALAHQTLPVDFAVTGSGWSNSAAGAGTVRASITLTAPAGFTQGLVTANMYVQAVHTGGADYLRVYPEIGGSQGYPGGTYVNAGSGDQTNISYTKLVTATSIVVEARVWTTWAVPADAGNIANITGSVLWLR